MKDLNHIIDRYVERKKTEKEEKTAMAESIDAIKEKYSDSISNIIQPAIKPIVVKLSKNGINSAFGPAPSGNSYLLRVIPEGLRSRASMIGLKINLSIEDGNRAYVVLHSEFGKYSISLNKMDSDWIQSRVLEYVEKRLDVS